MNILPKKSWHVRTKKNIERVRRDEAEAERLARIEQDRILRVEQEVRIRELRLRTDPSGVTETQGHINLFEAPDDIRQQTNSDNEEEKRQEEAKAQQRAGLFNRLGRSGDVNRPWYCQPKPELTDDIIPKPSTSNKRPRSDLITSIYDPMTTMKHAKEIFRAKKAERREKERLNIPSSGHLPGYQYHNRLDFQGPSQQKPSTPESKADFKHGERKIEESSNSSPEIVRVVENHSKRKHHKKKTKKHKRSSSEHRHKHKHRKHKRHKK